MSEFRVEKGRAEATLMLSNGTSVHGCFFVAGSSATHAGPERIRDVLNGETGFFPFEVGGRGAAQTVLFNREHVVVVTLPTDEEPHLDPGYDVATKRSVAVLLSNGSRMTGSVRVYRPEGRDRLSDYARAPETFRYLEAPHATFIFNVRHVLELTEEAS